MFLRLQVACCPVETDREPPDCDKSLTPADAHGRYGSWPCKNAKKLNRDRKNYSSKTDLVARLASEFNLEVQLKNIILVAFRFSQFLHTQGQTQKSGYSIGRSALPRMTEMPRDYLKRKKGDLSRHYSISSSAATRMACGTSRPSVFAVLVLMTSSNLVGRWTGSSSGLAPRNILPA